MLMISREVAAPHCLRSPGRVAEAQLEQPICSTQRNEGRCRLVTFSPAGRQGGSRALENAGKAHGRPEASDRARGLHLNNPLCFGHASARRSDEQRAKLAVKASSEGGRSFPRAGLR